MSEKYFFNEIEEASKQIIKEEVHNLLENKTFILGDCEFFIKQLTEAIGNRLKNNCDYFKYIINVIFLDNTNKGFCQNISPYYDPESDGVISLPFTFDKITCVVNLIATSL